MERLQKRSGHSQGANDDGFGNFTKSSFASDKALIFSCVIVGNNVGNTK